MSQRGNFQRGRRGGGALKRSRSGADSKNSREQARDGGARRKPAVIARSPEKAPSVPVQKDSAHEFVNWPEEDVSRPSDVPLSDPLMPADLVGVIGYCSDKSIGEIPGTLTSPSDIHKSVQDAKKYLFGAELESAMRASLEEYTKVSFCVLFVAIFIKYCVCFYHELFC